MTGKMTLALTLDKADIRYLIIYSGKQIADNESEYLNFKRDMQDWYNLQVICYR